jgi:hypothetical protein
VKRAVLIVVLVVGVIGAINAYAASVDVNAEDIASFSQTSVSIPTSPPPTTVKCKNLGHTHVDPNANPGHTHAADGSGLGHVHCPDQLPQMGIILDPDDPTLQSTETAVPAS